MGFANVGLSLTTDSWMDYDCTPVNVSAFAETGMDGGHYRFLRLGDDRHQADCPVVLTQPDCPDRFHVVVGESLVDFLSLGCCYTYFLGELPHRPAEIVARIEAKNQSQDNASKELALLRSEFNLRPWTNVGNKLWVLQERYLDELDIG